MTNPNTDEYAVTSWGESAAEPFGITLPSGQRCLVRKLEMEDVLAHGLLNDLDSFSSNLLEDVPTKDETDESVINAFQETEKFEKLTKTVNKIVMITVKRPTIYLVPLEGEIDPDTGLRVGQFNPKTGEKVTGRVKGRAYVDQVSFMDKMAIFQAVFEGLKGLDQFREGSEADLGSVENVEAVPSTAVVTGGNNSPL
jgi:hypothetical protein